MGLKIAGGSGVAVTLAILTLGLGSAHAQPDPNDLRVRAEAGDGKAEWQLGENYRSGNGVPKSAATAFCWFHRAAEHGNIKSWLSVAWMYSAGEGVSKDYIEAYKWFYLVDELTPPNWPAEIKRDAEEDRGDPCHEDVSSRGAGSKRARRRLVVRRKGARSASPWTAIRAIPGRQASLRLSPVTVIRCRLGGRRGNGRSPPFCDIPDVCFPAMTEGPQRPSASVAMFRYWAPAGLSVRVSLQPAQEE